jgi:hypothetical protein
MPWRKWFVRSLVLVSAALAGAVLFVYLSWTNPAVVREQVLGVLRCRLPGATVTLGSARLHLLGGIYINELHLCSRRGQAKDEIAYIPRATIYHDKEMLSKGTMAIDRIELPRAKLHIVRGPDGTWNVGSDILAEPDPRQRVPTMVFHQATLLVEDHFNPASLPAFKIKNLDLTVINDPIETLVFNGAGVTDLGGKVEVHGAWGRSSHELSLTVDAVDLPIDGNLVERVSHSYPQLAVHARQLSGLASIGADLRYRPDLRQPWTHSVHFRLTGGKFCHAQIPFPLEDLNCECRCTNSGLVIDRLSARSGDTLLEANGRVKGLVADADLEGRLKLEHLSLCPEVFKTLPDRLQAIQRDYNPRGVANLIVDFRRHGDRWRMDSSVQPRDISIQCAKFPYLLERVSGVLEHHLDQARPEGDSLNVRLLGYTSREGGPREVHIDGSVEGKAPAAVDIRITAKDVAIDEKLCQALTKPELQKIVRSFSPAGQTDIEAHILRTAGNATFDNRFFVHFHDTVVSYEVFPYPVENVSGTLDIRNNYWEFRDFTGTHNGATLRCAGRSARGADGGEFSATLTGTNLTLNPELESAIRNQSLKRTWQTLAPSGRIDFEAQIHRLPKVTEPDIEVTVFPRGCTVTPAFFPYTLTDLTGTVHYHQREAELIKLQARHGPTSVGLERAKVCLKPGGGVSVDMAELTGNPSPADSDLMNALPGHLQKAMAAVQSPQPLWLRTRLTVDVPEDRAEPSQVYWDGELEFTGLALPAALHVNAVTGRLGCRGLYHGGMRELLGNIELREATVFGQPLSDIHTAMRIAGNEPERLYLPNLKARLFGGSVGGAIWVSCDDRNSYEIQLTASQVRLEELARQNRLGPKARLSGLAGAQLFLRGEATDLDRLNGNGKVDVPNGKMCNLPVLLPLLKVLSGQFPDDTAFDDAHAVFGIQGRRIDFKRLELNGDAVSLSGKGSMNLDGSNLNLDFFAVWGRILQFLPPVIDQIPVKFSQALLKIKMRGDVRGKVDCTKEPLPPIVETFKEIVRRRQER